MKHQWAKAVYHEGSGKSGFTYDLVCGCGAQIVGLDMKFRRREKLERIAKRRGVPATCGEYRAVLAVLSS